MFRRRTAGGAAVIALAATVAAATLTAPAAESAAAAPADKTGALTTSAMLPFDLPAKARLRASGKKVYAHYISWSPRSLDNKPADVDYYTRNYLSPTGENGKYQASGGKQRDRPLPRPVRPEANWRLIDMEGEVRQAIAAGLDGFVISMVQRDGQWDDVTRLLLQAADNVDPQFQIVLRPNMISFDDTSPGHLARYLADLADHRSAARLADGRLIVSPFKSEKWSVGKWKSFLSTMKNTYNKPVAFWPTFHNERTWSSRFDSISYGMSNWGDRNPAWNDPVPTHKDSRLGRVAAIHALGQKWMQPVSVSDTRPREGLFDEAENTTNLRRTWQIAIRSNSDAVHIPTWNDHAESSQIQPTTKNGGAYLDLNSFYLTWYKTGTRPAIVRDTVYLSHRRHRVSAKPTYPQTKLMRLRGGSPARDTVEALTFLTAPARVTVQVGSRTHVCQNDAGIDACTVPLSTGRVSVKVDRGGTLVTGTVSPHVVTSRPYVQDFDYVAVTSGRRPLAGIAAASPSTPPIPPTPTGPTTTLTVTPRSDTYVDQATAGTNHGGSRWLASDGSPGRIAYLRFALPAAPAGKKLVAATLSVHTSEQTFARSARAHTVDLASNAWANPKITWSDRPAITATRLGTLRGAPALRTRYSTALDLTALAGMAGTERTFAVRSAGRDAMWFYSTNAPDDALRPKLRLTYK